MIGFKIANKTLDDNDINIEFKEYFKIEEDKYEKCQARVWDSGRGSQCVNKTNSNDCLCISHRNACDLRMPNKIWWLGLISEMRPSNPVNPTTGFIHQWIYDINGNKIIDEVKEEVEVVKKEKDIKVKKPRGRPKGSKNKKKEINK